MKALSRFTVKSGGEGVIFLRPGRFVIGRRNDCNLILDRRDISRHHAVIVQDEMRAVIEDLGSRNGVHVNGKKISRCQLDHAAVVQLGSVTGLFEWVDPRRESDDASTAALPEDQGPSGHGPLTTAERRVLTFVLSGFAEKEIAAKLELSRHTIHNHVKKIYAAFAVSSRAELLAWHIVRSKLS